MSLSFEFDVSAHELAGAEFIVIVQDELRRAFLTQVKAHNLSKKDIAEQLGCDKSEISRCLNGKSNLTARKIGELIEALGGKPEFRIRLHEDHKSNFRVIARRNRAADEILAVKVAIPQCSQTQKNAPSGVDWHVTGTSGSVEEKCHA